MNRLTYALLLFSSVGIAANAQHATTYTSAATGSEYEIVKDSKYAEYDGLSKSKREPSRRIYLEVNSYDQNNKVWIELDPFTQLSEWCDLLKGYAWDFERWCKRNNEEDHRRAFSHKFHSLDTLCVFFTYSDRDLHRQALGRMGDCRVSVEFDTDLQTGATRMILYGSRLEDDHHNSASLPGWSLVFTDPRREIAELTEKLKEVNARRHSNSPNNP